MYPCVVACCRINVLNILLPVKYNIENGYSSWLVKRKSTRRYICEDGIFATTRHFEEPSERTSIIICFFIRISTKSVNTLGAFEVIITSISPESW